MVQKNKTKKIITSGKRKMAVARAVLVGGSGNISINKKDYKTLQMFDKLRIQEPLKIAENVLGSSIGKDKLNFNVAINVRGGGEKSQISAARLALAKAIVEFTKSAELRRAFLGYDKHLLVADTRKKEAYKPGDSKARRKRQTSYR